MSISRLNLDALKFRDPDGRPIYQVPILEEYIPKLMDSIPVKYMDLVSKPYKSSKTNYYYIDVLCTGQENSLECVERIINFCGNIRIIPLKLF